MKSHSKFSLTDKEKNDFINNGYITVRNCINKKIIDEWRSDGLNRIRSIKKVPENGIIEMPHTQVEYFHNIAPRAWRAVLDLLGGEDRVQVPLIRDEWNLNTNSVDPAAWKPPELCTDRWHLDGDYFTHFLDSPEQGLLCLILWNDVKPKSGGTFLACDSIPLVAQHLLNNPQGLGPNDCSHLYSQCKNFIEITGQAGDVILCHPFMIHAPSPNTTNSIRLLTNPIIALNERMCFNRENPENYSLVEKSILQSLKMDKLNFIQNGKSEHFRAWRKDREVNDLAIQA